jgi:hypothetical protein
MGQEETGSSLQGIENGRGRTQYSRKHIMQIKSTEHTHRGRGSAKSKESRIGGESTMGSTQEKDE